ncbi:MAG TPA: hypothetical protein VNF27_08840 [Candidatus Binataceae bacterium]|nr:hypothetical protein [Candidatus Binataceae bacterium]
MAIASGSGGPRRDFHEDSQRSARMLDFLGLVYFLEALAQTPMLAIERNKAVSARGCAFLLLPAH